MDQTVYGNGNDNKEKEKKPSRFYELNELENLNTGLNKVDPVKIFVCNFCGQWNKVNESQLISSEELVRRRKEEKRVLLHIPVTREFKIMWDKYKANFGTHERALMVALSDFHKHNH